MIQRILIYAGICLLLIGLFWPWVSKFPLGRLPGDIIISKPNIRVFIPITTMIVVSLVLTFIMWIFRK